MALLYNGLGKARGGAKQKEQDDQEKLGLYGHPTISTHLEPEIRITAAAKNG